MPSLAIIAREEKKIQYEQFEWKYSVKLLLEIITCSVGEGHINWLWNLHNDQCCPKKSYNIFFELDDVLVKSYNCERITCKLVYWKVKATVYWIKTPNISRSYRKAAARYWCKLLNGHKPAL